MFTNIQIYGKILLGGGSNEKIFLLLQYESKEVLNE